jgi:hypothetical protein
MVDMSAPGTGRDMLRKAQTFLVAAICVGLAWRQLRFVDTHAVNMMYADQWDFYRPMFLGQGWWQTFDLQHGPHREGVGLLVTRVLANMSGWDSRWDSFAASLLLIGGAALGLRLARCFGIPGHSLLLAAVPLLFLDVHQYESLIGAVNLSHGVMPLALFMAYCLAWFLPRAVRRLMAIGALTFLLIFTGFGLFVGLLTPLVVGTEAVQALRRRDGSGAAIAAAALVITGAGWALFARGYTFEPAVAGYRFPYEHPFEYVVFVGRMLGNFFGAPVLSLIQLAIGLVAAAGLVAICAWNAIRLASNGVARDPRAVVLFCLSGFTLVFCANCAVGRVFTGPYAPLAPRYATLLIPGGLALFLQLGALATRRAFLGLAVAYTVLLIPGTAFLRAEEVVGANWYTDGKRAWRTAYLKTHDEGAADRVAHFSVYPFPIGERLRYLEKRELNLFLPHDSP